MLGLLCAVTKDTGKLLYVVKLQAVKKAHQLADFVTLYLSTGHKSSLSLLH